MILHTILIVIVLKPTITNTETRIVWKCCAKGMQLDVNAKTCVSTQGWNATSMNTETLSPPINKISFHWLPPTLLSERIEVHYDSLPSILLDVSSISYYEESHRSEYLNSHSDVHPSMISDSRYCYDTINNLNNSRVQLKTMKLKSLNKCCSKSERLGTSGKCIFDQNLSEKSLEEEIITVRANSSFLHWLPEDLLAHTLKIKYNFLKYDLSLNVIIAEGMDFKWDIVPFDKDVIKILFQGHKLSGNITSGTTDVFCFEKMSDDATTRRVLLTSVQLSDAITLWKCCSKESAIDESTSKCKLNENTSAPQLEKETLDSSSVDNSSNIWIPDPFRSYRVTVFYNTLATFEADFVITKQFKHYKDIVLRSKQIKEILPSMVSHKSICIDTDGNTNNNRIAFEGYQLKPIYKCCGRNERLSSTAESCELIPGLSQDVVEQEFILHSSSTESQRWLPQNVSKYALYIQYNVFQHRIPFNMVVPETSLESLLFTTRYPLLNEITLQGHNATGNTVGTTTSVFCFDEVKEGPLAPRVIMAFYPGTNTIWKCCKKGQSLNLNKTSCVGTHNISLVGSETLHYLQENSIYKWIPQSRAYPLEIKYDMLNHVSSDVRQVLVSRENVELKSAVDHKLHSKMISKKTFCFDSVHPSQLHVHLIGYKLKPIPKCCSQNNRLTSSGDCVRIPGLPEGNVTEEVIYPEESEKLYWLPTSLSSYAVRVEYNYVKKNLNYKLYLPADTSNWELKSLNDYNIAIEFKNVFSIYNLTVVTDTFCFEEVVDGAEKNRNLLMKFPKEVWKCCAQGMQLDETLERCVANEGVEAVNTESEILEPPIGGETYQWIPHEVRSFPLLVEYGKLSDVKKYYYFKIIHKKLIPVSLGKDYDNVHSGMYLNQVSCYDTTKLSDQLRVRVESYKLRVIYKCCRKGERLTESGNACEVMPGRTLQNIDTQNIYPENKHNNSWVPSKIANYGLKVKYNYLGVNIIPSIVAREEDVQWNVLPAQTPKISISFRGVDRSGNPVAGVSSNFCFDDVAVGPLAPIALLAATPQVHKCCKKGEQLNNYDSTCIPWKNRKVDDVLYGIVDWKKNPGDSYWLPTSLRDKPIYAFYNYLSKVFYTELAGWIFDENIWKLDYGFDRFSRLIINSSDFSGQPFIVDVDKFCVDSLADSRTVLVFSSPSNSHLVRKCCYPGEILSPSGYCEKHNGTDWSPARSKYSDKFLRQNSIHNVQIPVYYFCVESSFALYSPLSLRAEQYFEGNTFDNGKYSTSMFCNDWQRTWTGGLEEVVASCTFPRYAWSYEHVRSLGAAAVALLLAAAVVTVVREETRHSVHGRALVCHALCLAASNAVQVAAHFINPESSHCTPYAYSAYFFMTAANMWLTSITCNMFLNFRQPLGALAASARAGVGARAGLWRFAVMSVASWGAAASLTGLSIAMYHRWRHSRSPSLVLPSFYETRTCMSEEYLGTYYVGLEDPQKVLLYNTLGSVYYYYLPAALMVTANAVFIVLTTVKIQSLRRGTSILRRDDTGGASATPPHLQKAFFYAKLLLTTGFLELVVEAVFWSSGRQTSAKDSSLILPKNNKYLFPILATLVDFLRAISVFWLSTKRWLKIGASCRRLTAWVREPLNNIWNRVRKNISEMCKKPTEVEESSANTNVGDDPSTNRQSHINLPAVSLQRIRDWANTARERVRHRLTRSQQAPTADSRSDLTDNEPGNGRRSLNVTLRTISQWVTLFPRGVRRRQSEEQQDDVNGQLELENKCSTVGSQEQ